MTHVTRPEDWPVMPVAYAGFSMKPVGFFDSNPALDVPPSSHYGCACHSDASQNGASHGCTCHT